MSLLYWIGVVVVVALMVYLVAVLFFPEKFS
jgi:K+-transporting ATPase KdpF subunit